MIHEMTKNQIETMETYIKTQASGAILRDLLRKAYKQGFMANSENQSLDEWMIKETVKRAELK